jgi:hypothetical protein
MTTPDRPSGLADVLEDHLAAEFATRDVDATMATMTDDPYLYQASLLVQVGLLDPAGLPVTGAEQAEKLLAPRSIPTNALLGPDWSHPR